MINMQKKILKSFQGLSDFNSICKMIAKVCAVVTLAIFGFFISILWWTSTCMTSYIPGGGNEKVYFVRDYPLVKIIIFLVALAGLYFLYQTNFWKRITEKISEKQTFLLLKKVILTCVFLMALIWSVSTQTIPAYDQDSALTAASRLFFSDYHDFFSDQYMGTCTNQIGLAFWEYLVMKIAGIRNVLFFLILNSFFAMLVFKKLSEIGEVLGMNRVDQLVIMLSGLVFWPISLYTTFLYGTLPGLALSLTAICGMHRFLNGSKWYMALLSGICWIPAVGVKENYYIFLIGALIYFTVECIRKKSFIKLWYPFVFALLCIISLTATRSFLEKKIGFSISKGISPWAYVTMGLQDNPSKAPGWYNAYVRNSYSEFGYDTVAQEEDAKRILGELKKKFAEDHSYRNSFFLQKMVSQWDEPTFQGFWIYQTRSNSIILAKWTNRLKNDAAIKPLREILDVFMFFAYTGTLLFVLFCPGKKTFRYMAFAIIFIGGFLFHLVWEAKAQYTLPYFSLLIPYAIMGITEALGRIRTFTGKLGKKKIKPFWDKPIFYVPAGAILLGFTLLIYFKTTDSWIDTKEDTQTVQDYLTEEKAKLDPTVPDGVYRIREIQSGRMIYIGNNIEETYYATGISDNMDSSLDYHLTIRTYNSVSRIISMNEEKSEDRYRILESYNQENEEYRMVRANRMTSAREQEWRIEKEENGYYTIRQDDQHILTYDPDRNILCLKPQDETYNQYFEILPCK